MVKKLRKDVSDFTAAGVGLGIGTLTIAKMPGGSAITPAFAAAGGMMRPVGVAMMGGSVLRQLEKYPGTTKRRKQK